MADTSEPDDVKEFWDHNEIVFSKVLAHSWLDEGYKQQFVDQPERVLRDEGMVLPPDVQVRVLTDATYFGDLEMIWDAAARTLTVPVPARPDHYGNETLIKAVGGEVRIISSSC